MKQRIGWIDISKGILIILVIIGHSHINTLLDYAINAFHMAGFFLLSGITFNGKRRFKDFVKRKINSLLLPYVVFSFILIAYQYVSHILLGTNFSLVSGVVSMLIPISGREGTTVYHLWFLPCLFLAEIVIYWIVRAYRKKKVAGIGFASVGILFGVLAYSLTGIASIISVLPLAVGFMLVGFCSRSRLKNAKPLLLIASALFFIVFTICNYRFGAKSVDMSSMTLGIWPLYFLCGLSGGIFVVCLSQMIGNSKVLEAIGSKSLYYYGLHYEVLGVANKIRGGVVAAALTLTTLYIVFYLYDKLKINLVRKGRDIA